MTKSTCTRTLSEIITSDADERMSVRRVGPDEILVGVLPEADEDDCLTEAAEAVERLYGDHEGVSSVTAVGWEGGDSGPRDYVLVRIGGLVG